MHILRGLLGSWAFIIHHSSLITAISPREGVPQYEITQISYFVQEQEETQSKRKK